MKTNLLVITMGILPFLGCGNKGNLTPEENRLLQNLKFDTELLTEVKDQTQHTFKQLPAIDPETGEQLSDQYFEGIYSEVNVKEAVNIVKQLKSKFRKKGY